MTSRSRCRFMGAMSRLGNIVVLFVFMALLGPIKVEAIEPAQLQADEQTAFQHQDSQEVTTHYRRADTWFNRNERLIFWAVMALPYLALAGFIAFVIWDAKHPPRPIKSAELRRFEKLRKDPDKWNALIEALREVSKDNEEVATALRQHGLL